MVMNINSSNTSEASTLILLIDSVMTRVVATAICDPSQVSEININNLIEIRPYYKIFFI